MKYIHSKDIRYNGKGYNAEWVRNHGTEAAFVKKCKDTNLALNENNAKELFALANQTDQPVKSHDKK